MSELFEKSIRTLELPRVLELLAEQAVSAEAKARCRRLRPETEPEEVLRLLDQTDAARQMMGLRGSPSFSGVKPVAEALDRADRGGSLNTRELLTIADLLTAARRCKEYFNADAAEKTAIDHLFLSLHGNRFLEEKIKRCLPDEDTVADAASPELADIRRHMRAAQAKSRQILQRVISSPSYAKILQETIITQRDGRFVVPVKAEHKGDLPGLVHDISSTGATLFVEPMGVVQANNEYIELQAKEQKEIERILAELSAEAAAHREDIQWDYDALVHLDVIFARGQLSYKMEAARPEVRRDGVIYLRKARHPLLDPKQAVPIDIQLGDTFDTLVITGPNTGGKTVTLKTLGLLTLMTQCGLHIPVGDRSVISVYERVLADIGDEQSIEQSLSTFSAHMTNLISILNEVKAGDLVLIDEICAGTDPNEGAALAMAMLEHLHEQGVLTMVTTHYSELKTFAYGHEGMENASVEFDPVSLRPTYRLLMGVPGSSNAFNISRRLGLAEDIIKNAGELLNQEHVHMENVLQELDSERRRYESGSKEIEDLRRESEQLRNALAYSKSEFERRKNEMLRKAREQADEIYRRSRRESEAVLKELRSMKADFDTKRLEQAAEEARKKLNKTLSEDAPLPEGAPLSAKTAKKGLNVFVVSLGKNGIITDVNGNDVTVQVGILKMTVPAKKCLLTKAQPAHTDAAPKKRKGFSKNAAANYAHQMFIAKSGSAKQEIDLRGMTLDEAIPVVDKAIDDALIAGIGQLRPLHGKGTGALRAGLTAYLSTNRFVKKLETAALEAGGSGATVIDL